MDRNHLNNFEDLQNYIEIGPVVLDKERVFKFLVKKAIFSSCDLDINGPDKKNKFFYIDI